MSSRSILIAVLGLTLNGCAVYDYDDERYDSRYYGNGGYNVQRYEVYPSYPVYQQGYRYDYPRHDGYSNRYYSNSYDGRHDGRHDRDDRYDHRERYDRHDNDRHDGRKHPRPQPYGAGPSKQGWDGQRQHSRDQVRRERVTKPVASKPRPGKPVQQQVNRSRDRGQEHRQVPRQDKPSLRYGEPADKPRHAH